MGCKGCELSIFIASRQRIRVLNKEYLGRDRTTNVLSFPQSEEPGGGVLRTRSDLILGDVVISPDVVTLRAGIHRREAEEEFAETLVHGILHLLGYEHTGLRIRRREMMYAEGCIMNVLKRESPSGWQGIFK